MSATTSPPPTLNSHEQALVQYRSISKLALLALGLGLLSALVLINPLLSFVALVTIAVALLSLRQIQGSGGQIVGRTPAVAGLCLAMLFLGWGLAARFSRSLTLEKHSREFAESWLDLVVRGDLQQADQLRAPATNRMRSPEKRKEFYANNPEALAGMNAFFNGPPLSDFIALGPAVKYEFDSMDGSERTNLSDRLILRYTFRGTTAGSGPSSLWITVKRQNEEDHIDWQIEHVSGESSSKR